MDFNQLFFKYGVYYPSVYLRFQNVPRYLNELKISQYYSRKQIENIQLYKLNKLIEFSKKYVTAYKNNNYKINRINSLDDMSLLPFTTKDMLKHDVENLKSKEFRFITEKTTGGSTGEPITIPKTSDSMARELSATWRGYSWAKIDIGDRQARFWGVPFSKKNRYRAILTDLICNRKRCSAFSFNDNDLLKFTTIINHFKPSYFYGYVSMLCEYANYLKRSDEKLNFNLKAVITTSEVLTIAQKNQLENYFNTKVYNEYGCGELGSVAHECEHGSLHIMAENMIVEVVDGNRTCKEGEMGELVITELNNYALPLIRYRTGDYGSILFEECKCGRSLPIIQSVKGRAYDTIINSSGKKFHGEFFMYIIEASKQMNLGINAFQVKQLSPNHLEFRLVVNQSYSSMSENFIRNRLYKDFDPNVMIDFVITKSIEREKSGKLRVVIGEQHPLM